MRITVFTDVHASDTALEALAQKAKDTDIFLCAGDISIFETGLTHTLKALDALGKPVYIIPGNHEDEVVLEHHVEKYPNIINVHRQAHTHASFLFVGYGGGGFAHRDENFVALEPTFSRAISQHRSHHPNGKVFLILHQPPHDTKLDQVWESSSGNKDYTDFIKKYQPDYVICGHIHENAGKKDSIGKCTLINPGPEGETLEL